MLIQKLSSCTEITAGDGSILRELLHPDKLPVKLRYSLAHAVVKPHGVTKPHRLKTSEVYYILEGKGRMSIEGETQDVSSGEAIYIPPGSTQWIENTGSRDLVFLCIVDPAWQKRDEMVG
jgi:mannose-6-phosphate isomerase-like protein (cupin superfamily)